MRKQRNIANNFSKNALSRTFALLRIKYPSLALEIQNTITQSSNDKDITPIKLNFDAKKVSEIVIALSSIGELAASTANSNRKELIHVHGTLLDWLVYAQSFIHDIDIKVTPEPAHSTQTID